MIRRTLNFTHLQISAISALALLGSLVAVTHAVGASSRKIHIAVNDAHGTVIATSDKTLRDGSAVVAFEHEYQPGDHLVVSGPQQMAVRVDDRMPECLIYLANSPQTVFSFDIPYGHGEPQTRSAFSQDSFAGAMHRVTARALTSQELSGYRNLAMNACDQELQPPSGEGAGAQKQAVVSPHASTNSVSRSLPDFRARNAVDGMTQNGHHGIWPYQSWGPELRNDLWWKIDFGRQVDVDKIRLMVRADFPHDSYWQSAVVEFSDGGQVPITISQSAEFQDFTFPKRSVSWIRLNKLVAADPARWCSFIEIEAWGRAV